jgi:hypothetical protein
MVRNNVVLIPPEDLGSGSQFSVMKSLLSETILQVEFCSLILGANNGIQIKLDIQYYIYIWLHGDRIHSVHSRPGPTKEVSALLGHSVTPHTVSPSCWAWTPR